MMDAADVIFAIADVLIFLFSYMYIKFSGIPTGTKTDKCATLPVVCYTAVFSVVTLLSSCGEKRCVTTLKTAL